MVRAQAPGHGHRHKTGDSAPADAGSSRYRLRHRALATPATNRQNKSARSDTRCQAKDSAASGSRAPTRSARAEEAQSKNVAFGSGADGQALATTHCAALPIRLSSSSCAARLSWSDAALTKWARSNGALNRTTHKPHASDAEWRVIAARIWRLSNVRVTERRAWRFGTTVPSHTASGAARGVSSTGDESIGTSPVNNSAATRFAARFKGVLGPSATWCNAKCALLTRVRVRSTRSKSADRTRCAIMGTLTRCNATA